MHVIEVCIMYIYHSVQHAIMTLHLIMYITSQLKMTIINFKSFEKNKNGVQDLLKIKVEELTLFRKTALSCKKFKDLSFSCSYVSHEYDEEALRPPSSMPSSLSNRAFLDARLSLQTKKIKSCA